jgi:hypothetical protein
MRNSVILLLILAVMLLPGCSEEYEITVINESSYPIDFEFNTGHRLNELRLNPGEEWHHSLLKALGHSMGTFKPLSATTIKVDYRYSDYVYTFYDAYTLTFSVNGGAAKKDKKAPVALTVITLDKIEMPDGGDLLERYNPTESRYYDFKGWATTASGTGTNVIVYNVGTLYSFSTNPALYANQTLYAKWE